MQTLNLNQIENVSGGTAENMCIAASAFTGGLIGGGIGAYFTGGAGAWAGFEGGAVVGGIAGGLACGYFFD